jgi:hypothetical protein
VAHHHCGRLQNTRVLSLSVQDMLEPPTVTLITVLCLWVQLGTSDKMLLVRAAGPMEQAAPWGLLCHYCALQLTSPCLSFPPVPGPELYGFFFLFMSLGCQAHQPFYPLYLARPVLKPTSEFHLQACLTLSPFFQAVSCSTLSRRQGLQAWCALWE